MNKNVILGAKLHLREQSLADIQVALDDIQERTAAALRAVDEAQTEVELDEADKTLEELQSELDEKQSEKAKLEEEIASIKAELEELKDKTPKQTEKGERKMGKNIEVRSKLNAFIRSEGTEKEGLKTVDGGALIPNELLAPQKEPAKEKSLLSLVNVVKVTSGSGKYPVLSKSGKKMNSVAELAKNPELAKPKIKNVSYDIETYRGSIPISQELLDDADYDIMDLVLEDAQDQAENTKEYEIATILKTATAKSAAGFDGLKDVINSIKSVYNVSLVVTDSMFAAMDKVKDKIGKYSLQPDVTSPTGYSFGGRHIYTVEDTVFGEEGDMKAFVGDVKEFVTLFDRLQLTLKWIDSEIYGQLIGIYVRFDTQKTDEKAGYFVTYTDVAE
ncbi:capsid protein [Streptococcus cuniculi]|uniref:Capsid protein n=1 Tax=Streptococcus cuniculi TaxID=1432788 RepID=A0A1Q8E670_9STRE|nr:phage major capsid protein [Streptococcus cuniculi]OLF47300.1 capsid protein [Streptococcus cuniculi]QBX23153.1 capsid protein [Streptococcus phage Javan116]